MAFVDVWFANPTSKLYRYVVVQGGTHRTRDVKAFGSPGEASSYAAQIGANAPRGVTYTIRKDTR